MATLERIRTQNPVNRHHPLARNLVSWWLTIPQWYGGNKWYDLCGKNPGTLTGMGAGAGWIGTTRPGGQGNLKFLGTGEQVDLASTITVAGTDNWGFSFWAYQAADNDSGMVMGNDTDTNNFVWISNATGIRFRNSAGSDFSVAQSAAIRTAWQHYAVTYFAQSGTTGTLTIYRNGVAIGNAGSNGITGSLSVKCFGDGYTGNTFDLAGGVDAIHYYNRCPAAAEVMWLYNESRLGYPGLLNRWGWPLAGASSRTFSIGQIAETNLAQVFAHIKRKTIGQNLQTDLSQPVTIIKAKSIGQSLETDTPQSVSSRKSKTIGLNAETDTSQHLTISKVKSIGINTETDTTQPVSSRKSKSIGQNLETDLTQMLAHSRVKLIGQAQETDVAVAFSKIKRFAIGQITESDIAQALVHIKSLRVGSVTEADLAQSFLHLRRATIGQITETELSQALSHLKVKMIGQSLETDVALTLGLTDFLFTQLERDLRGVSRGTFRGR